MATCNKYKTLYRLLGSKRKIFSVWISCNSWNKSKVIFWESNFRKFRSLSACTSNKRQQYLLLKCIILKEIRYLLTDPPRGILDGSWHGNVIPSRDHIMVNMSLFVLEDQKRNQWRGTVSNGLSLYLRPIENFLTISAKLQCFPVICLFERV